MEAECPCCLLIWCSLFLICWSLGGSKLRSENYPSLINKNKGHQSTETHRIKTKVLKFYLPKQTPLPPVSPFHPVKQKSVRTFHSQHGRPLPAGSPGAPSHWCYKTHTVIITQCKHTWPVQTWSMWLFWNLLVQNRRIFFTPGELPIDNCDWKLWATERQMTFFQ